MEIDSDKKFSVFVSYISVNCNELITDLVKLKFVVKSTCGESRDRSEYRTFGQLSSDSRSSVSLQDMKKSNRMAD